MHSKPRTPRITTPAIVNKADDGCRPTGRDTSSAGTSSTFCHKAWGSRRSIMPTLAWMLLATIMLQPGGCSASASASAIENGSDDDHRVVSLDRRSRLWVPPEGAELYVVPVHPITVPTDLQRSPPPASPADASPSGSPPTSTPPSPFVHFSSKAATPPPSNSTKGGNGSGKNNSTMPTIISVPLQNLNADTVVCSLGIGTPAQNFSIVLDTGSSDFWVPSTACTTIVCIGLNRFSANRSSTYREEGKALDAKYGDGSFVSGVTGIDTIALSRTKVANQSFGLAAVDETSVAQKGVEGVLGLNVGRAASVKNYISLVENLISRKVLSQPIVSVWMGRQRLGGAVEGSGGAFIIGGVDTTKYVGNFTWNPAVDRNAWKIRMQGVSLAGHDLGLQADVLVDTGTSLIIMPAEAANVFHGRIPQAQNVPQVGWIIPCNTTAGDLNFTLGGQKFRVPQEELIVLFRIPGYQDYCKSAVDVSPTGPTEWILGSAFLKNVYTVFDFRSRAIGFANPSNLYNSLTNITLLPNLFGLGSSNGTGHNDTGTNPGPDPGSNSGARLLEAGGTTLLTMYATVAVSAVVALFVDLLPLLE
ncbi:hypothetical protein BGZ73_008432 [Actinomortierella ambigua]|nr:hypothetical protein BGZ73_008432 [Actinomortierella ambigua]